MTLTAPRPTGDELRLARGWARARCNTGLGRGWWGWAWVWLNLVRAGVAADDRRSRRTIARRLGRETPAPSGLIGAMVGSAAGPTVAALLTRIDPGHRALLAREIARWERSCRGDHGSDFLYGAAGALVAAAEIERLVPSAVPPRLPAALQREVARELRGHLEARAGLTVYLGLAHGLAGFLLALECGRAAFGLDLPGALRAAAIDRLMAERLCGPRNIAGWPVAPAADPIVANAWCSGTAGVALVALAGQRLSGDRAYDQLVACAVPSTHALQGGHFHAFCCGTTGQAQVLLEAYQLLGDRRWLARARATAALAHRAPGSGDRTFTWGALGVRYLALRLAHPGRLPLPGLGPLSV